MIDILVILEESLPVSACYMHFDGTRSLRAITLHSYLVKDISQGSVKESKLILLVLMVVS